MAELRRIGFLVFVLLLLSSTGLGADTVILHGGRVLKNVKARVDGDVLIVRTRNGRKYSFPIESVAKIRFGAIQKQSGKKKRPRKKRPIKAPRKSKRAAVKPKPKLKKTAKPAPAAPKRPSQKRKATASAPHPLWALNPFLSPLLFGREKLYGGLLTFGKLLAVHRLYTYATATSLEARNSKLLPGNELFFIQFGLGPDFVYFLQERGRNTFVDPHNPERFVSRRKLSIRKNNVIATLAGLILLDFYLAKMEHAEMRVRVDAGLNDGDRRVTWSVRFGLGED